MKKNTAKSFDPTNISTLFLILFFCAGLVGCKKASEEVKPDDANNPDNFWRKITPPNTPRISGIMGQLADGRLILSSGLKRGATTASESTEIYDPATDKWTTVSATSPECSAGQFFRLKNGKMILLNYSSAIVQVFDPATNKWTSPGQHGGQAGDWNTVSGACELENGNVILVGRSSLTVWDQKSSFVTYSMNSGSSSLRFATVHQLPGTNQFIVFGNVQYNGLGRIYELDADAGNAPKPVSDQILNFAGIKMQSEQIGNQLVFMGGSNGTNVGNSANSPTVFNSTDKTYTRLIEADGTSFGVSSIPNFITKDASGKIWFADDRLYRYYIDPATQKVHPVLNTLDETKAVPMPFKGDFLTAEAAGAGLLKDGNLLLFYNNEAWITK